MKKVCLILIAMIGLSTVAQADVTAPAWVCALDAENVSGANVGLFVSGGGLEGLAKVTCMNVLTGEVNVREAAVVMTKIGLGLGFTVYKDLYIRSAQMGVANPNKIYGSYKLGGIAGVNFITVEGGVVVSATADLNPALSFEMGIYGANATGLGANIQAYFMEIMTPEAYKALKKSQEEALINKPNGN